MQRDFANPICIFGVVIPDSKLPKSTKACVKLHKIACKTSRSRLRLGLCSRPRRERSLESLASWPKRADSPYKGIKWGGERRTRGGADGEEGEEKGKEDARIGE